MKGIVLIMIASAVLLASGAQAQFVGPGCESITTVAAAIKA